MDNYGFLLNNEYTRGSDDYSLVACGVADEIKPIITKLMELRLYPDSKKRRFSRLTFNISKSYVKNKLNEIRLYGSREADKLIDRFTAPSNDPLKSIVVGEINRRRTNIKRLLCNLATEQDGERLACFFVPFIYGGIVSLRNAMGESTRFIDFETTSGNIEPDLLKKAILKASGAIFRAKNNGISIIIVRGRQNEIFSPELCRAYADSPEQAFILIERCADREICGGAAAYSRDVMERLHYAKNVFVLVEQGSEAENHAKEDKNVTHSGYEGKNEAESELLRRELAIAKVKALKCYKILSGVLLTDGYNTGVGKDGCSCGVNEAVYPIFDGSLGIVDFLRRYGVDISNITTRIGAKVEEMGQYRAKGNTFVRGSAIKKGTAEDINISALSAELRAIIEKMTVFSDKSIVYPNIIEILTLIQYISGGGRVNKIKFDRI